MSNTLEKPPLADWQQRFLDKYRETKRQQAQAKAQQEADELYLFKNEAIELFQRLFKQKLNIERQLTIESIQRADCHKAIALIDGLKFACYPFGDHSLLKLISPDGYHHDVNSPDTIGWYLDTHGIPDVPADPPFPEEYPDE